MKGWTVVFTGDRTHADIVAAALAAHGLQVQAYGDFGFGTGSGFNVVASGVMVPDDQAQAARRIIKQAQEAPIPPDEPEQV